VPSHDLPSLEDAAGFARRHLGPSEADQTAMLAAIGVADVPSLLDRAVPDVIRDDTPLDLPAPASEATVLARLRALADRNTVRRACIGLGYHGTVTPAVIRRNILEDPGWYTAYTPYQPEISQGRLEALLVFQTMVTDLTGTELAGASLLDEATAAAEGLTLCHRVSRKRDADRLLVDVPCHPQTLAVVRTRAVPLGLEVVEVDPRDPDALAEVDLTTVVAALLQQPGSDGRVHDDTELIDRLHEAEVLVTVATDLLACTVMTPPGEQGADVVVGSSQRFGVPMMFGGPHAAFLATRESYARSLPGRLVGVSVDTEGREAYRLALQTREQHIRRERATSNICTSQVLLAVVAGMYAVHHGPDGLARIARRVHALTAALRAGLTRTASRSSATRSSTPWCCGSPATRAVSTGRPSRPATSSATSTTITSASRSTRRPPATTSARCSAPSRAAPARTTRCVGWRTRPSPARTRVSRGSPPAWSAPATTSPTLASTATAPRPS
jgi:glycine dehydrogenase